MQVIFGVLDDLRVFREIGHSFLGKKTRMIERARFSWPLFFGDEFLDHKKPEIRNASRISAN
jgi:hypothetical protein